MNYADYLEKLASGLQQEIMELKESNARVRAMDIKIRNENTQLKEEIELLKRGVTVKREDFRKELLELVDKFCEVYENKGIGGMSKEHWFEDFASYLEHYDFGNI